MSKQSFLDPRVVVFVMASAVGCGGPGGAMMDVLPQDSARMDVGGDTRDDAGAGTDTLVADTVDDTVEVDRGVVSTDSSADADVGPYPAGPYGNAMGDVIANLSWEGYVNTTGGAVSTTRPYTPTSMQAQRMLGRRYALVHVSEFL